MINGTPDPTMGEGAAGSPGDSADQTPKSVEEVDAFWRHRQSQSDKAHAAEVAALNARIAGFTAAPAQPPVTESPEAARIRELEAAVAAERSARQAEALKSQYPMTGRILGDFVGSLPEEKLAAIESVFGGSAGILSPPIVDPNSAPRSAGISARQAKPLDQMSKEELLGELGKVAGPYQQALREGLL